MKSIICVLLALVMLLSLTACGEQSDNTKSDDTETTTDTTATEQSSDEEKTTDSIMTVDGVGITEMMYTAALYQTYYELYYVQGLYQYDQLYGTGVWEQTYPYGDDETELTLEEYIIQLTKDNLIRQVAVQKLMDEHDIVVPDHKLQEQRDGYKDVDESEMLKYGFDKESYMAVQAATLEESTLFYTLYGKGGAREILEEELRLFFDDHYFAYKSIALSDSDEHRKLMIRVLNRYTQSGDIDTVLREYDAESVYMLFADSESDPPSLIKALRTVEVGTAKVVNYTIDDTDYVALVYRYDIDEAYEEAGRNGYFESEGKDLCIYRLQYDAFDEEVKALARSLTVEYDQAVIDLIKPKRFLEIDQEDTEDEKDPAEYEGDLRLVDEDGNEWVLTGNVKSARAIWQQDDTTGETQPIVSLQFDEEGTQKFKEATAKNLNSMLMIYVGEELVSAPTVNEVISNGEVVITVSDYDEAERLAAIIEAAAR